MTTLSFSHDGQEYQIFVPASTLLLIHADSYKDEKYLVYQHRSKSIQLIETSLTTIDAIFRLNKIEPCDLYLWYNDQYARNIRLTTESYNMRNEPGGDFDLCKFCHNYQTNILEKQAEEIKHLKEQVEHLMYIPGAPGYQEAKTHFDTLL